MYESIRESKGESIMMNSADVGFIHDLSSLDKLRQQAVGQSGQDDDATLEAAAKQFESIFTNMLFQSMRNANSGFETDLVNSQNQSFYRQMLDEQMSSELSSNGSLGLADMIVKQLKAAQGSDASDHQPTTELAIRTRGFKVKIDESTQAPVEPISMKDKAMGNTIFNSDKSNMDRVSDTMAMKATTKKPVSFDSPTSFVEQLTPYARKAAAILGVEPSLLVAQAALETGWGKKVISNSKDNSYNLFNIKADRSWKGGKIAKQTLEYHDNTPVKELANFRSYANFEQSFKDYVQFLKENPRYKTALTQSNSSKDFIQGIHKAGYATDPQYSDKVLSIKRRIDRMQAN